MWEMWVLRNFAQMDAPLSAIQRHIGRESLADVGNVGLTHFRPNRCVLDAI